MFEIQKHIPIPETRGAPTEYPFHQMDIWDSFSVPLSARRAATSQGRWSRTESISVAYGGRRNAEVTGT